jgi:hypothetical protein
MSMHLGDGGIVASIDASTGTHAGSARGDHLHICIARSRCDTAQQHHVGRQDQGIPVSAGVGEHHFRFRGARIESGTIDTNAR